MQKLKYFFKIEFILLYIAVINFSVTEYCRMKAGRMFAQLDADFSLVQNAVASQVINDKITDDFLNKLKPYVYFDSGFSQDFNKVRLALGLPATLNAPDFDVTDTIILLSDFQNKIHNIQRGVSSGFDTLMFFSAALMIIVGAFIIYKQILQKSEFERFKAVNEVQKKFSRDLHDTVAQDLAAVKIYQQTGENQKSQFYAERALSQTRYLIDTLHQNLSKPFKELVQETLISFENNCQIKTDFSCMSALVEKLSSSQSIEILYILHEALSNIARHANASQVTVKMIDVADELIIKIHDDGSGFAEEEAVQTAGKKDGKNHYGLKNMKERAEELGGTLEIINEGGTTIAIHIKNIVS